MSSSSEAPEINTDGHSASTQLLDAYILKESRKPPTCTLIITASHLQDRKSIRKLPIFKFFFYKVDIKNGSVIETTMETYVIKPLP